MFCGGLDRAETQCFMGDRAFRVDSFGQFRGGFCGWMKVLRTEWIVGGGFWKVEVSGPGRERREAVFRFWQEFFFDAGPAPNYLCFVGDRGFQAFSFFQVFSGCFSIVRAGGAFGCVRMCSDPYEPGRASQAGGRTGSDAVAGVGHGVWSSLRGRLMRWSARLRDSVPHLCSGGVVWGVSGFPQ